MNSNVATENLVAIRRREMLDGAKATIPLIIGAIPFGIIFGTLAEPSGLSALGGIGDVGYCICRLWTVYCVGDCWRQALLCQ